MNKLIISLSVMLAISIMQRTGQGPLVKDSFGKSDKNQTVSDESGNESACHE